MSLEELLTPAERSAVERIVSTSLGHGARIEAASSIRANDTRVLRVRSSDRSWIVKRPGQRDEERLYGAWGFFSEWVGAATVTAAATGVSPEFRGGDADETVMVADDVGDGLDVSQVLRAGDRAAAVAALVEMGSALGRLHAGTAFPQVEHGYRTLWRKLCGDRPEPRISLPAATLSESLDQALASGDVDFRFDTPDLHELEAWVRESRQGRSLIHGDPCLDNWILDEDRRPKLIDFQAASFAPAALDAAYARAPFPTCWCLRRLPADIVDRFEEAHRAALARAGMALGDPALHRRHLTYATAWWFMVQVLLRIARAGAQGAADPGEYLGFRLVPFRDSILLRLDSFVELSATTGVLGHLADQTNDLRTELVERWAEPVVDVYPAFDESNDDGRRASSPRV